MLPFKMTLTMSARFVTYFFFSFFYVSLLPVATSSNGSECLCDACQIFLTKAELETRRRKPLKSTKQIYLFLGNAGFLGLADRTEGQEVREKKNGA